MFHVVPGSLVLAKDPKGAFQGVLLEVADIFDRHGKVLRQEAAVLDYRPDKRQPMILPPRWAVEWRSLREGLENPVAVLRDLGYMLQPDGAFRERDWRPIVRVDLTSRSVSP